jgi:hypothetical protein
MKMNPIDDDPLLQLVGSGNDLWADEHAENMCAVCAKAGTNPPNFGKTPSSRHQIFGGDVGRSNYAASRFRISFPSFCASPKCF